MSGGFPGVLPFHPTFRLAGLDMSEIILKGMLNLKISIHSVKGMTLFQFCECTVSLLATQHNGLNLSCVLYFTRQMNYHNFAVSVLIHKYYLMKTIQCIFQYGWIPSTAYRRGSS